MWGNTRPGRVAAGKKVRLSKSSETNQGDAHEDHRLSDRARGVHDIGQKATAVWPKMKLPIVSSHSF